MANINLKSKHQPKRNQRKLNNLYFFQFCDVELRELFAKCIFPNGYSIGPGCYRAHKYRGLS